MDINSTVGVKNDDFMIFLMILYDFLARVLPGLPH